MKRICIFFVMAVEMFMQIRSDFFFEFWNIGEASALAVVVWVAFFVFCNVFYQIAKKRLNAF